MSVKRVVVQFNNVTVFLNPANPNWEEFWFSVGAAVGGRGYHPASMDAQRVHQYISDSINYLLEHPEISEALTPEGYRYVLSVNKIRVYWGEAVEFPDGLEWTSAYTDVQKGWYHPIRMLHCKGDAAGTYSSKMVLSFLITGLDEDPLAFDWPLRRPLERATDEQMDEYIRSSIVGRYGDLIETDELIRLVNLQLELGVPVNKIRVTDGTLTMDVVMSTYN